MLKRSYLKRSNKPINKVSKNESAKLKRKAWKVWSIHIRSKDADRNGMVRCYTCGVERRWREMHAGHLYHNKLDFDERNIHPQCPKCNTFLHGNLAIYATKMIEEIGVDGMKKLILDSNTTTYTADDFKKIIEKYKI